MLFLTRLETYAYDAVQHALGLGLVRKRLARLLAQTDGALVLDVGGGTGLYAECLPRSARYLCLDIDATKLEGFRARHGSRRAVLADGSRIPLRDKSIDYAMCINVTHHLPDEQLDRLVSELARIVRRGVVLHDALRTTRCASRILWGLDNGRHPRPRASLIAAIERRLRVEHIEEYGRFHQYLLVSAIPLTQQIG